MKYFIKFATPVGEFTAIEEDGFLQRLTREDLTAEILNYNSSETPLLTKTRLQIQEYFEGIVYTFDIPIRPEGSNFMKNCWNALLSIPYGETRSYKDIAVMIGNPKASRAVGMANNRNPITIIIPCHRVIGSDGSLTGYRGGLQMKQMLLDLEAKL
jgi:methylated-DNA-[protein]-cysteine S-methyltransferase